MAVSSHDEVSWTPPHPPNQTLNGSFKSRWSSVTRPDPPNQTLNGSVKSWWSSVTPPHPPNQTLNGSVKSWWSSTKDRMIPSHSGKPAHQSDSVDISSRFRMGGPKSCVWNGPKWCVKVWGVCEFCRVALSDAFWVALSDAGAKQMAYSNWKCIHMCRFGTQHIAQLRMNTKVHFAMQVLPNISPSWKWIQIGKVFAPYYHLMKCLIEN